MHSRVAERTPAHAPLPCCCPRRRCPAALGRLRLAAHRNLLVRNRNVWNNLATQLASASPRPKLTRNALYVFDIEQLTGVVPYVTDQCCPLYSAECRCLCLSRPLSCRSWPPGSRGEDLSWPTRPRWQWATAERVSRSIYISYECRTDLNRNTCIRCVRCSLLQYCLFQAFRLSRYT